MKVLSIIWAQCSTTALMVDGEVIACASEERFSRIKNDDRYPKQAIESILKMTRTDPSTLDLVVFAGEQFDAKAVLVHKYSGFSVEDRIREQQAYWYPRMYLSQDVSYLDVFRDKIDTGQYGGDWNAVVDITGHRSAEQENEFYQGFRKRAICDHLGISPEKVKFVNHHRAHAYYAYYASPIKKDDETVLVLTADAWGDGLNATVSLAQGTKMQLLKSCDNFQGGRLYRSMTLLLGMKPDEHEYKVMGLAAYAKPDYYQGPYEVFNHTQYVDGLGFAYHLKPPDLYVYFRDRLEGYRFDAVAGALQQYTEEILTDWTRNCLVQTGATRVVFGGGVGMNVKAMMQLARLPEVEDLFVCPSPSDESLAIGAAYAATHDHLESLGLNTAGVLQPMADAYLGIEASDAEVREVVLAFRQHPDYAVHEEADSRYLSERLAEGKILGRCVGRGEFGARALGNRSIVADPRQPGVIKRINEGVKSRDFWMPFAPTILAERADDYLIKRKQMKAPYMTMAFETSPLAQREIIASLHQADLTCRPQILERKHNPSYYDLIDNFQDVTGVGGVLNTSFNLHGEPIVQTPADAARVFKESGLDLLQLGDFVIEKATASQTPVR